jgi:hypothetical protein
VTVLGEQRDYTRSSDEGDKRVFSFCPECGATVYYRIPSDPGLVAVPVGAFADPTSPARGRFIYEDRRPPLGWQRGYRVGTPPAWSTSRNRPTPRATP